MICACLAQERRWFRWKDCLPKQSGGGFGRIRARAKHVTMETTMGTPTWQRRLLATLTRLEIGQTRVVQELEQVNSRLTQIVDNVAVGPESVRARLARLERHVGIGPPSCSLPHTHRIPPSAV